MRLTLTHRLRPDRERVFAEPDDTHAQTLAADLVHKPVINPLNKEINRRIHIVAPSPNSAALLRLAGTDLVEQHDEWEASVRQLEALNLDSPMGCGLGSAR